MAFCVLWSLWPQNRAAAATRGRGRCELSAISSLTPKIASGRRFLLGLKHSGVAIRIGDSESIFRDSTLLRFDTMSCLCFTLRKFWRFLARDSGNRAIRDSQFCAGKHTIFHVEGVLMPNFVVGLS